MYLKVFLLQSEEKKDFNILPWIQTQHLYFVYPRRLSWSISTHNFAWNYYNESLYPAIKMRPICSIAMLQWRKSPEYMILYLNRIHRLIWNRNCVSYPAKSSIEYTRLINNYIFAKAYPATLKMNVSKVTYIHSFFTYLIYFYLEKRSNIKEKRRCIIILNKQLSCWICYLVHDNDSRCK